MMKKSSQRQDGRHSENIVAAYTGSQVGAYFLKVYLVDLENGG